MAHIPYLEGSGKLTRIIVDGKPFRARSGEIHNSSASSLDYLADVTFPALRGLNLNCVIAPVYWECIEPQEGVFDFTLVDGLIEQARAEGVRLALLWFGLWKNGESHYVPEWVKRDTQRFWYVEGCIAKANLSYKSMGVVGDSRIRTISPLCAAGVEADRKAFVELMKHLASIDEQRTVIAVQVENEIGTLGTARDMSAAANEAFAQPIPAAIADAFGVGGTWSDAFGADAPECFMAWHFSNAVESIASAGKAVYPLPLFVNAWLEQAPWTAGAYPSGGPQFKMHKVWRIGAPSIDFYTPDIYIEDFRGVCCEYCSDGNPLFIPETTPNAAYYLYAVGAHNAMCFAPFGIDSMKQRFADLPADRSPILQLAEAYKLVEGMEELIEEAHQQGRVHGFLKDRTTCENIVLRDLVLQVKYNESDGGGFIEVNRGGSIGGGLVVELGDYEYAVLAVNCNVTCMPREERCENLDLIRKEEGRFADGVWTRGRILNGDEQYDNNFGATPKMLRVKVAPYKDR